MSIPSPKPQLTPDQRRGVETTGVSLLMSAAAGSGKTRVLAERCAYLVCDAPLDVRCRVTELLVVTFTEAAAAEMRDRIDRALEARSAGRVDPRLEEQRALLEQAQISTLHSFCAQLLREHFHRVGLDPAFTVIDEHEAMLLRLEVGRELVRGHYAADTDGTYQRLLDAYFDGSDERLLREVLRVHDLLGSLLDPGKWVADAKGRIDEATVAGADLSKTELGKRLTYLLRRQITAIGQRCNSANALLATLGKFLPYEKRVEEVRQICRHIYTLLNDAGVDAVNEVVNEVQFERLPSVKSDVPNKEVAKDAVDGVMKEFKEGSWRKLLNFTEAQWQAGLAKTRPHLTELLKLVDQFGQRYRLAKDEARQLDFADLERYALNVLLADPKRPDQLVPSAAARYYHGAFKQVLVDEYQDINELQNAILSLVSHECLAAGKDEGEGSRLSATGRPSTSSPSPSVPSSFILPPSSLALPPNLFCVGDVKQSIYRFRLADPDQFLKRRAALARGAGEVIDLQQNFRSRGPLLEAINAIFGRLMTQTAAEIEYDASQRLVPGRVFADADGVDVFPGSPIELHVLAKSAGAEAAGTTGSGTAADKSDGAGEDDDGDAGWDRTEREAAFVARRIMQIVGRDGRPPTYVFDRDGVTPRPASYRDIVILLRSKKYKAAQYVRILEGYGVPVHAESGTGFFESTEVRDVLALLCLLDNQSQDLELAAHLRSPLARLPRPEDALATVRVAYRGGSGPGGGADGKPVPFHEAVVRYAAEKTDALSADLRRVLAELADLRREANRQPVHETLWRVYDKTGYLTYVAGLPGGRQRQANLTELYDRARRFANHRRQGLGRFLEFLNTLSAETDVGQPSLASEAQDVVRVMTVHASKGLEFPIVFVPDCGKKINLSDQMGPILLDRHRGVGMPVADEELFARYPSLAQVLVKDQLHRRAMAEELRVLYVALTRAMEHLILVGTAEPESADGWSRRWTGHDGPLPESTIVGARSVLDWVGPVWAAGRTAGQQWIELLQHALEDLEDPRVKRRQRDRSAEVQAIRELKPIDLSASSLSAGSALDAGSEFDADGDADADADDGSANGGRMHSIDLAVAEWEAELAADLVIDRLTYAYPHEPRTRQPAAAGVVESARSAGPASAFVLAATGTATGMGAAPDGRAAGGSLDSGSLDLPTFMVAATATAASASGNAKPSAALVGTATHAALHHLRFADAADRRAIERQLDQMVADRRLPAEHRRAVDVEAIEWFVGTDLGRLLGEHEPTLFRELPVYASTGAVAGDEFGEGEGGSGGSGDVGSETGSGSPATPEDRTMLRGRLDVLVPLPAGAIVIDYKTESARGGADAADRAGAQRAQVRAYADVIGRVTGMPVAKAYIVLLAARQVVEA